MLLREADRAVGLQRRARRQQCGVGRRHERGADIACSVIGAVRQRQRGAVDQRPGQLDSDIGVGKLVLDRLVGPDGPAELTALFRVVHRGVQHGLARTDQLCRIREHSVLESLCGVGLLRIAGSRRIEQLACRVDRLMLTARAAVAHLTVARDQNQSDRVGVDGAWHMRR